jgi:hypothetical protein
MGYTQRRRLNTLGKFTVLLLVVAAIFITTRILLTRNVAPTDSRAAAACTIYVSPDGKDSNSGSSPSSPLTLITANLKTVPGSVVCLMDGTYLLTKPLYIAQSGTDIAWITYRAQNAQKAIIKWNTSNSDDMFQMTKGNPGTRYIEVSDLVFDGSYNGTNTALSAVHGHVGTHHLKVLNNHIKNTKGSGIGMGESDYNTIIGNRIHHIGNYSGDGENGWGSGITFNAGRWHDRYSGIHSYIVGNVISGVVDGSTYNTDGNGIIMDKSLNESDGTPPVLIANNVIFQSGGRCIHNLVVTNTWVVNNTCYSNSLDGRVANTGSVGEYTFQRARNIYHVNNVVYAWTKGYTFMQSGDSSNIRYHNNVAFGGKGTVGVNSTATSDSRQIKVADPLYLSPPRLDANADRQYASALSPQEIADKFYLKAGSPAINSGIDPTTLTTDSNLKKDLAQYVYKDIEGKARPQGGAFDAGAFEYAGSAPASSPLPPAGGTTAPRPTATATPRPAPTATSKPTPSSTPSAGGSKVVIYAAGTAVSGVYANMDLLVDQKKVASWTNVKPDLVKRTYTTYTYNSPTKLTRSQIRIAFTNDGVNQDRTEDRSLVVDKIILDGVTYQTEASTTYSTGTYTQGTGCSAGNKKSEWLNCNGYFQY